MIILPLIFSFAFILIKNKCVYHGLNRLLHTLLWAGLDVVNSRL